MRRLPVMADFPVGRDASGHRLCRWCKGRIKPPRRTVCSEACVEQLLLRVNPAHLRKRIFERDRGVCARCHCDTEMLGRVLEHARRATADLLGVKRGWANLWWWTHEVDWLLERLGFQYGRTNWEIDHVIELNDNGQHAPENLQTLCVPCHKVKTREYAVIRAVRARVRAMREGGDARACV